MKTEIFEKLKQVYAPLGLGDAFLQARAELLANLGFVTDENIESVIAAQRAELESIQKSNDKRATDAIAAEKKKAEEAAAAAKSASDAEMQKHLAKIKELEEQLKKANPTPPGTIGEEKIKELIAEARKADSDELKSLKASLESLQKGNKELADYKAQAEKEKADREKAQAAAERKSKIETKAKELGIPEWRIKEGLNIADDVDDAGIDTYLGTIAQNIKVNLLPNRGAGGYHGSDEKVTKEQTDNLVAAIMK